MPEILDTLDVIHNLEYIYDNDKAFRIVKDFERVIDELGLYVYANWEDGELVEGPSVSRHWVTCSFMWPRDKMPDPMGGKRLVDYDCKIQYTKSSIIKPRKIQKPDDMRPGTKKGKLDRHPVWLVTIRMPKQLIIDIYGGAMDIEALPELEKKQGGAAASMPAPLPGAAPAPLPGAAPAAPPPGASTAPPAPAGGI
jgi:hypothetical protein